MIFKEIYFPYIDSTNTYLKNHFLELQNFSIVRANYQTSGHGRQDRSWVSEKGKNLLFSILIKDENIVKNGGFLSLVAAISLCEVIEKSFPNISKPMIKWPNDIYINDKKVCGILLESNLPEYIVIGVGLNVNQKLFDGEYRKEPTSLSLEIGKDVRIENLKESIYQTLIDNLGNAEIRKETYLNYYRSHNYLLGKRVSYVQNNVSSLGIIKGVDESFNIIIETRTKQLHISSGEIDLVK